MIRDLMNLARDVDRLYRARLDMRRHPSRLRDRNGPWKPSPEEARAFVLFAKIEGRDEPVCLHGWRTKASMRSRSHVAMLALTERKHFRRSLGRIKVGTAGAYRDGDDIWVYDDAEVRARGRDNAYSIPVRMIAFDIARMARFLQILDMRLTGYRHAEADHLAIIAATMADAASDVPEAEPLSMRTKRPCWKSPDRW